MSEYKYAVPLVYGTNLIKLSGESYTGINVYNAVPGNLSADASTYKNWTSTECILLGDAETEDDGRMIWRAAVSFAFAPGGPNTSAEVLNWRWRDVTNNVTVVSGQVTTRGTLGWPRSYEIVVAAGPRWAGTPAGPMRLVFQYATSVIDTVNKPGWLGGPGWIEAYRQ